MINQRYMAGLFGALVYTAGGFAQPIPAFPGADGAARMSLVGAAGSSITSPN